MNCLEKKKLEVLLHVNYSVHLMAQTIEFRR